MKIKRSGCCWPQPAAPTSFYLHLPYKNRPCERVKRQFPIFPWVCTHSIIGAEELNYRVRDGNGCTLFAKITGSPAHTGGFFNEEYITILAHVCQYFCRSFL